MDARGCGRLGNCNGAIHRAILARPNLLRRLIG
jgi:hypothetical protein